MADVDYAQMVKDQAAIIATLQDQLTSIQSRLPPAPEPAVKPGGEYPRLLYREGGAAAQIDVPGNEIKRVESESECKAALVDGWKKDPFIAGLKKK